MVYDSNKSMNFFLLFFMCFMLVFAILHIIGNNISLVSCTIIVYCKHTQSLYTNVLKANKKNLMNKSHSHVINKTTNEQIIIVVF